MGHLYIRLGFVLVVVAMLPVTFGGRSAGGADERAAGPVLAPTRHPPVPEDLSLVWLVPSDTSDALPADVRKRLTTLRTAIELLKKDEHARALALLDPGSFQGMMAAEYVAYYRGLALLQLERHPEARAAFGTLRARRPTGFLAEAALLKEAEVAELEEDDAAAADLYEILAGQSTTKPDLVLHRLGQTALAAGHRERAARAFARLYYEFPLSDLAASARTALKDLGDVLAPARERFTLDLGRAERLFGSRRYAEARDAFRDISRLASGGDRELVELRLAECDFHLRRYATALAGIRPFLDRGSRQAEANFFYFTTLRASGQHAEYIRRARRLVEQFPESIWAEETLNGLGTHYILVDEDEKAAEIFAELYERFPGGQRAERAAWKAGWWAYRQESPARTIHYFESAAATFPRSDYRPAYLYWAGRSHDRLGNRGEADARYALVVTDYGSSYYGRLASKLMRDREATPPLQTEVAPAVAATATDNGNPDQPPSMPQTEGLIRLLISLELYEEALNEIEHARRVWGDSPALGATLAYVYNRQGDLRRGINAMKRAYPQFMTAAGVHLPEGIRRVIFPLDYWPSIRKHAEARKLDPYLMAALIAQESSFDPKIRSAANAYGLMQILPSTGRQLARRIGAGRFRTSMLTDADTNLRMGMRYFADLLAQFGEPHLALAAYNAGAHRVRRWIAERRDLNLTADEFVDDIPFPETQNYVKRILGTAEDYRQLYGSS